MKLDLSNLSNAQFNIVCGVVIGVVDVAIIKILVDARKPGGTEIDIKKFVPFLKEMSKFFENKGIIKYD